MRANRYLYFQGCQIGPGLPHYDRSIRAVMAALDIELVDWEWNCCGYPMRHQDLAASVLGSARNLAVAARKGLALMTPCKCCYGQLRHAEYWLRERQALRRQVNGILAPEGLAWAPEVPVRHLLQVLVMASDRGALRDRIRRPLQGVRIAAHYGCHALRPGNVVQFDNPRNPTLFEKLVAATGATAVDWPLRLECCGDPLRERNDHLAHKLAARKYDDARQAGAQLLATACTHCQMQFDRACGGQARAGGNPLPAVLYSQILGRALDLPVDELGLAASALQAGL
jgi:heterodisulfide reductase subunit B